MTKARRTPRAGLTSSPAVNPLAASRRFRQSRPTARQPGGMMPSDSEFLSLFGEEAATVRLAPGEALFSEGEPGDCMYLVRSGTVRVSTGTTMLDQFGAGSILGEMALIDETPRSATVV